MRCATIIEPSVGSLSGLYRCLALFDIVDCSLDKGGELPDNVAGEVDGRAEGRAGEDVLEVEGGGFVRVVGG